MPSEISTVLNILIADARPVIRFGIKCLLQDRFPLSKTGESENGDQVLEHCSREPVQVLIMDIDMPGMEAQILVNTLMVRQPSLAILILTERREELFGPLYLKLGVKGFINRLVSTQEIIRAVELVISGEVYIKEEMRNFYSGQHQWQSPYDKLTRKERIILKYLVQGESVTNIGKRTYNSINTISTHKANIFRKLGLNNIIDLKMLTDSYPIGL